MGVGRVGPVERKREEGREGVKDLLKVQM